MNKDQKLNELWLQVPKHESSFVYFQLEANEGLCFYSTIKKDLNTCLLHLQYDDSLSDEFNQLIRYLSSKIEITQIKTDPLAGEAE